MRSIVIVIIFLGFIGVSCKKRSSAPRISDVAPAAAEFDSLNLTMTAFRDKIRGGWAGQVIGCSYGGPTEFKFKGSMIQEYQPIVWYDDYIKDTFEADP